MKKNFWLCTFLFLMICILPGVSVQAAPCEIRSLPDSPGDAYDRVGSAVGGLVNLLLTILAGYFGLRVFLGIFVGEIDLMAGRPGALADVLIQLVSSLLILIIAQQAGQLGGTLSRLAVYQAENLQGVKTAIISLVLDPLMDFALILAVCGAVVSIVYFALRVQISNLLGLRGGIQEGIVGILTVSILITSGFLALRALGQIF